MSGQKNTGSARDTFSLAEAEHASKASVLIADDHSLVREALAIVLQGTPRFRVLQSASLHETLQMIALENVDIVLLDLVMPGMDGMSGVNKLLAAAPQTSVVLFSGSTNSRFVSQALENGARGFIPKTMSVRSVGAALQMILDGEIYVPASMLSELKSERVTVPGSAVSADLSEIERHTLSMAASGKTNKEIAWALQTTEVLVKMHMRSICRKLQAKNRTHAAIRARELGMM